MLTSGPMGAALWVAAGVAAFLVARIVPLRRKPVFVAELILAVITSVIFGIAATALDFGGWNEADWRALTFAFSGAMAVIGAMRALRR